MVDKKKIADFFFEAGQLKRVKRSGWWLINIKDPESIAEHSYRAAVIGYVLAKLEKADSSKVVLACLFQDFAEARINDLHKVGHKYIDFKDAEKKAFEEQVHNLPAEAKQELTKLLGEFQTDSSKEGLVARDADLLENACQAREYIDIGYRDAQNWINNIKKIIRTESGKKLLSIIEKTSSNDWWRELKKIAR